MSEYWKSTPRYWCKHCSVFVKDTKLERSNHEASGKHQYSIKRFLREIHKDNEREKRDKQRAKDEIARLAGDPAATKNQSTATPSKNENEATVQRQATAEERQKQAAQLAAMGVALPEEFRQQLAMAGDWQKVPDPSESQNSRPSVSTFGKHKLQKPEPESARDATPKRKTEPEETWFDSEPSKRPRWGTAIKSYNDVDSSAELDKLLNDDIDAGDTRVKTHSPGISDGSVPVKAEETEGDEQRITSEASKSDIDKEDKGSVSKDLHDDAVVFKRRRPRQGRG